LGILGYYHPILINQLPSLIAGYDYYQFEMGKDDGMEEWRTNLKNVFKKTSSTTNHSVLFLYETQVFNFIKIICTYLQTEILIGFFADD
jgi:hypothetical protein